MRLIRHRYQEEEPPSLVNFLNLRHEAVLGHRYQLYLYPHYWLNSKILVLCGYEKRKDKVG